MSKRDYGGFMGDEDDGDDGGFCPDEDNHNNQAHTGPGVTYQGLLNNLWGKRASRDNFNYNDISSIDGTGDEQSEINGRERARNRNKKTKYKHPPPAPAPAASKGADNDDDSESDIELNEEKGQPNVGGNTKKEQEKRFYGFRGEEFLKMIALTGSAIKKHDPEKQHIEEARKKLNSKVPADREEARRMMADKTHMNPAVKDEFCRVCELVHADNFNFTQRYDTMNSMQAMQRFDLNTCGYTNEAQLFEYLKDKYNALEASTSSGREVKVLFTVDEIAHCYQNHNKMNLKRVLYKAVQTAAALTEDCLRHVKGKADDGRDIFLIEAGKAAIFFQEKQVAFTKQLIETDLFYHQAGMLKSVHAAATNGGANTQRGGQKGAAVYTKTAATGQFKGKIF